MLYIYIFFFFNDTATTEIYTLSLHDALPISGPQGVRVPRPRRGHQAADPDGDRGAVQGHRDGRPHDGGAGQAAHRRSEEHTSELQSRLHLVCRLLLEKKKNIYVSQIKIVVLT